MACYKLVSRARAVVEERFSDRALFLFFTCPVVVMTTLVLHVAYLGLIHLAEPIPLQDLDSWFPSSKHTHLVIPGDHPLTY